MPFQVVVTCPDTVDVSALPLSAMHISFSDERPDVVVRASKEGDFVDVGAVGSSVAADKAEASLRWERGRRLVVSGRLQSDGEGEINVRGSVTLGLFTEVIYSAVQSSSFSKRALGLSSLSFQPKI